MVLRQVISSDIKKIFMLGNEAIFRGALEAAVKVETQIRKTPFFSVVCLQ
jgi:TPP-dependent indolepyruvate ferredoxin oxidoreductase alpha subunit